MKFSSKGKAIESIIAPSLIIAFAAVMRLLPHPANVAPITAMALFGGVYMDKKYALVVPLIAMLVSDIFLGFHSTMVFVYGSFLFIGVLGLWLRKHKTVGTVIGLSFFSSLLFFLITNFGTWGMTQMYPKTFVGLMDAYVMGIPFFRNTILGDLLYVGLFFGSYELVKSLLMQKIVSKKNA